MKGDFPIVLQAADPSFYYKQDILPHVFQNPGLLPVDRVKAEPIQIRHDCRLALAEVFFVLPCALQIRGAKALLARLEYG